MTKIINLFICCLITFTSFSQSFIEENYASLANQEDVTRVTVGEKMFSIAATLTKDAKDSDTKEAHKFISKIKSFDLLSVENIGDGFSKFKAGLAKCQNFEELIRVKDKENNISIRIDESNDVIHQIIGLIAADSNFVVFNLVGDIDINEINTLINHIQDEKVSKILGTKNFKVDDVKVYPNPAKSGQKTTLDIPENLVGGTLSIFDMEGRKVKEMKLEGSSVELNTAGYSNNTYMLKFEKGPIMLNRKLIIIE